jgi:dolichyl-diphosphooligosaccharide--protein glycosyltransferase
MLNHSLSGACLSLRSMGGSYDNEGVAIFALVFCFYLWVRAVHTGSILWSCLSALSYYYMVSAWGGYIFIINVIPIFTLAMLVGGRYSPRLYVAYTGFYILGSICAMTVPFVGFNVVDRAECAASHGVFVALQLYALVSVLNSMASSEFITRLKYVVLVMSLTTVAIVAAYLVSLQMSGALQWTGRSLTLLDPTYASKFIPIIASVSEHQPTSWTEYFFDLHILVPLSPIGIYVLLVDHVEREGAVFVLIYGCIAWYFSGVMVRLMLTLAPAACILGGVAMSHLLTKFGAILKYNHLESWYHWFFPSGIFSSKDTSMFKTIHGRMTSSVALLLIALLYAGQIFFLYHCIFTALYAYSSPSIVVDAGVNRDGARITLDDFREAYFWLRQNTDANSKVLSWWDYGYQLSAMANRTVIVDNNTWNNTHIATVGRVLASTEEKAYPIIESLDVDYVLVIFGGKVGYSSDDINKLLWPIRIGRGVFPDDMPLEQAYLDAGGMNVGPNAPPALRDSLAYKLCYYRFNDIKEKYMQNPGYDMDRYHSKYDIYFVS